MIGNSAMKTKLCPFCANSIREDAANCPYCKGELSSDRAPQWLKRDDPASESRFGSKKSKRFSIPPKVFWPAIVVIAALIAFFTGGYLERSDRYESTEANLKQLQAKEQIIQSQEAQLAQIQQQLNDSSTQLTEMKTKFEETQRELATTKQRLGATIREVARLNTSLATTSRRAASRVPDTAASIPGAAQRPAAEPGVYETTRATSVYENPSSAARVITQIRSGTRINVVSSSGGWLAVRSKHGNPPGYVWANDARLIARSN